MTREHPPQQFEVGERDRAPARKRRTEGDHCRASDGGRNSPQYGLGPPTPTTTSSMRAIRKSLRSRMSSRG